VQSVTVVGLNHRTEPELLGRVSLIGENVLTLPVGQIQATLTEDPWLRSVEVKRQLPNRVTLQVEERVPAAVWDGKGGRYLADADGTLLDPAPPKTDLPVVRDLDGPVRIPGDRLGTDAAGVAAKLVKALPETIGQRAKTFEYVRNGGLVVETDKGKRARLGDGADIDYKLAVWKALLLRGDTEKLVVGHVDLRFGDRPFFRDK
jgi:cell division protein FtsQ